MNIDSNTRDSWDCQNSNYLYPPAGHVISGTLNVIPDARLRNIISKGPKYRFSSNIDFPNVNASLNDFSNRWCKRENVEPDALNLSITNDIVSSKIYDKQDDFNFEIVNSPFFDGDVPRSPSYGVYIS